MFHTARQLFSLPRSVLASVASSAANPRGFYQYHGGANADSINAFQFGTRDPVAKRRPYFASQPGLTEAEWLPFANHPNPAFGAPHHLFNDHLTRVFDDLSSLAHVLLSALQDELRLPLLAKHASNDSYIELKQYKVMQSNVAEPKPWSAMPQPPPGMPLDEKELFGLVFFLCTTALTRTRRLQESIQAATNDPSQAEQLKTHRDLSTLTLLLQQDVHAGAALQVFHRQTQRFIDAPPMGMQQPACHAHAPTNSQCRFGQCWRFP